MKEIVLRVSDAKFRFIMELIQHLGIEIAEGVDISEAHQAIVRKKIAASIPSSLVPWKEARKKLNHPT